MLPSTLTRIVGWAVAVFYDVERAGPGLADGPVLVTANHPNALIDPLVVFHTGGRTTRPLAKAPLFEQPLVGSVLKGLGGLPIYRREDDPALMHLNERTFDAAIAALQAGEAVQIYPEGRSHSEPSLTPLRTGAARIALLAEERAGWTLGLRIQPVGLTYARKHLFRGRVVATFGAPFEVSRYRRSYEEDPRKAARTLTRELQERLEALTLNFDAAEDEELVDVAERLWAADKGLARPRERKPLAERLPRLRRFARGLRWVRDVDPERLERLRHHTARYLSLVKLLGVREGDVPSRFQASSVARYVAWHSTMLAVVLPFALMGIAVWLPPFLLVRRIIPRFNPKLDQIATYKLSVALVAFPLWLAGVVLAVFLLLGGTAALIALGLLPVTGLAAIAWRERGSMVLEDLRVFLRLQDRAEARARVGELRRELVHEIDEVARMWQEERRSRASAVEDA